MPFSLKFNSLSENIPFFGFISQNLLDVAFFEPKWTRLSYLERSAVPIPIEKKWLNCARLPHSMLLFTTNYLSIQMNEGFVLRFTFHPQTKVITSTIQHQVVRFNTSFDHVASTRHTWIDWISGSWTIRTGTSSLQFNTFLRNNSWFITLHGEPSLHLYPWPLRFIQFHNELATYLKE